jgi:formylglycine-generating enzyme required for sulfatase activity
MNSLQHKDWHLPRFAEVLCGSMTDRERLGLPDHYVEGRWDAAVAQALSTMRSLSVWELLCSLKSVHATLAERLAAAQVLALVGDPRIRIDQPDMVLIPQADVWIGLAEYEVDTVLNTFDGLGLNKVWIEKECPRHSVHLKAYKLARYPVTNAEYKVFLIETGFTELPTSWDFRRYPSERSNHPVYTVSAKAADAYAAWLSQRTGRAFRLPTEAEWEWAAAGPDHFEFPWGNDFEADKANTAETGLFNSTPVGVFTTGVSPFGVSDMAGNVEEYVADNYQAYPGGKHVTDHLVDIHGQYRVARGGSFARFRDLARTRRRHGHNPKSPTYAMGFRLAETV